MNFPILFQLILFIIFDLNHPAPPITQAEFPFVINLDNLEKILDKTIISENDTLPQSKALSEEFQKLVENKIISTEHGEPFVNEQNIVIRLDTFITFYPDTYEEEIKILKNELGLVNGSDTFWFYNVDPVPNAVDDFNPVNLHQEIDKFPQFPGGINALVKYIQDILIYPEKAIANNIEVVVPIIFVISANGSLINLKLKTDPGNGLGMEALRIGRLIAEKYKWKPGQLNKNNVSVEMTFPINFEL